MDISRNAILPGSDRTAADLGADGASVREDRDGSKHVTVWNRDGSRFSYDVDWEGNFVERSAHYTDAASELMADKFNRRW
jgi:hypothetical protein